MDRLFISYYVCFFFRYFKNKNFLNSYLFYYFGTLVDRFYYWLERFLFLYFLVGISVCGFFGYFYRVKLWIIGFCFLGGFVNILLF